jgi:hypothetical protein
LEVNSPGLGKSDNLTVNLQETLSQNHPS